MDKVLTQALASLGEKRPVFHSEADFQFALAWEIKRICPDADIRLEIPLRAGDRAYEIDLLYRIEGRRVAVELKYFKAGLQATIRGEHYRLSRQAAFLNHRYDAVKDIERLEHILALDYVDEAYAVILTNQPTYWMESRGNGGLDSEFRLDEGRSLSGLLNWRDENSGTARKRPNPLILVGRYELRWLAYSHIPDQEHGEFRVLVVKAQSGQVPVTTVSPPAVQRPPVNQSTRRQPRGSRQKYQRLAEFLAAQSGPEMRMSFAQVEELVGALPRSAHGHRAWWGNHARNPQARWMDVGWRVSDLNAAGQQITFRKV